MQRFVLPLLVIMSQTSARAAEPFRHLLASVEKNIRVDAWESRSKEITPASPGWSVRKVALHGGKQEDVDLVIVDNGKLQFTVVPTRGMGIREVRSGDVRLGWDSPVKEIVNPHHLNLQSRGGLGWLEGFNDGWSAAAWRATGIPARTSSSTTSARRRRWS